MNNQWNSPDSDRMNRGRAAKAMSAVMNTDRTAKKLPNQLVDANCKCWYDALVSDMYTEAISPLQNEHFQILIFNMILITMYDYILTRKEFHSQQEKHSGLITKAAWSYPPVQVVAVKRPAASPPTGRKNKQTKGRNEKTRDVFLLNSWFMRPSWSFPLYTTSEVGVKLNLIQSQNKTVLLCGSKRNCSFEVK